MPNKNQPPSSLRRESSRQASKDLTTSSMRVFHSSNSGILRGVTRASGIMLYPLIALVEMLTAQFNNETSKNHDLEKRLLNHEITSEQAQKEYQQRKKEKTTLGQLINLFFFTLTLAFALSAIFANSAFTATVGPFALGVFALISISKSLLNISIALVKYFNSKDEEEQAAQKLAIIENTVSLLTMIAISTLLLFYPVQGIVTTMLFTAMAILSSAYIVYTVYKAHTEKHESQNRLELLLARYTYQKNADKPEPVEDNKNITQKKRVNKLDLINIVLSENTESSRFDKVQHKKHEVKVKQHRKKPRRKQLKKPKKHKKPKRWG